MHRRIVTHVDASERYRRLIAGPEPELAGVIPPFVLNDLTRRFSRRQLGSVIARRTDDFGLCTASAHAGIWTGVCPSHTNEGRGREFRK